MNRRQTQFCCLTRAGYSQRLNLSFTDCSGPRVSGEGGSFLPGLGGGGSRPGPAGQTWGRSSPLGCPRSLPPAFSVFPPADFLLSAPFQSLGWGQHTTPQKGHYKELSGGPQACLSTFKRIRETTKGVMFSFVCQRPAARQEGHTALGLRRLIIQCVFYFKAKPSVLP